MAMNDYQWRTFRAKPRKLTHVYDIEVITTLAILVEALSKKIDGLLEIQ